MKSAEGIVEHRDYSFTHKASLEVIRVEFRPPPFVKAGGKLSVARIFRGFSIE
jgi:hypothetical protein